MPYPIRSVLALALLTTACAAEPNHHENEPRGKCIAAAVTIGDAR